MHVSQIINAAQAKICGGSAFNWKCYGPNARFLDFDGLVDPDTTSCVFDCDTQEVYEASICGEDVSHAMRWVNPKYFDAMVAEAQERGVNEFVAWDETSWVFFTNEDEFLDVVSDYYYQKLEVEETDETGDVTVDLDLETELGLYRAAHAQDITLNQLVNNILRAEIEKHKAKQADEGCCGQGCTQNKEQSEVSRGTSGYFGGGGCSN